MTFPSDPDSDDVGSGIVAKNGTTPIATAPPSSSSAPSSKPAQPKPAPPPMVNLSRKPSLPNTNACKGFFPTDADDDDAVVSVEVSVRATGEVAAVTVLTESPKGQGFGTAARACLLELGFVPALDVDGHPTPGSATVTVRFSR